MPRLTMVEFPSSDAKKSGDFFQEVFGWPNLAYGPGYIDVQLGAEQTLGFQQDRHQASAAPLTIIEVDDLDDARRAIEAAGGVITREPFSFPGGKRFHFQEPGGSELAVWVPVPS